MTLIEILKELENIFECSVSKLKDAKGEHSQLEIVESIGNVLVCVSIGENDITIYNQNGYLYSNGEFATNPKNK